MGAGQSSGVGQLAGPSNASNDHQEHGILIVNPEPGQKLEKNQIVLPKRVPPILTIDGHRIDSERHKHQLNPQLWAEFVITLNDYANSRADLVAARQSQLQERIVFVDTHVQEFSDSYVNDMHKALARMNDDCKKVEEINKLLHKCTIQSETCLDMLNKLNFLLPPDHKLETLEA